MEILIYITYLIACIIIFRIIYIKKHTENLILRVELFETVKKKLNPVLEESWDKIFDIELLTYIRSNQIPDDNHLLDVKLKHYNLTKFLLGEQYFSLYINVFGNEDQLILYCASFFDKKFKEMFYQLKSNNLAAALGD